MVSPVRKLPSQCPVGGLTAHVGFKSTAQITFWLFGLFSRHKVLISPTSPAREKARLTWHQVLPLVPPDWTPSSQCHRVTTVRVCQAWGDESTRSRLTRGNAVHGAGAVAVGVPSPPHGQRPPSPYRLLPGEVMWTLLGPQPARRSASAGEVSFFHVGSSRQITEPKPRPTQHKLYSVAKEWRSGN